MGCVEMPKPVYILCCQTGSDDKGTNLASHFNVYDRLDVLATHADLVSDPPKIIVPIPLRIVAVWSGDEQNDFKAEFEVEAALRVPPTGMEVKVWSGKFRFEEERPRQRFTFDINGFYVNSSGEIVAECRIRKAGDSKWLKQRYSIKVVISTDREDRVAPSQVVSTESDRPRRRPIIRPNEDTP